MKKKLRWTLGLGLGLTLLIVALWQLENRRGRKNWEETCARLRAAGEPVELADIIPPYIPDEENVAAAPIFAEVFEDEERAPLVRFANALEGRAPRRITAGGGEAMFRPTARPLFAEDMSHLEEWREYLRAWFPGATPSAPMSAADEILHFFGQWDGETQELREALKRPKCRWPLRYKDGEEMRASMLMVCSYLVRNERPRILAQAAKGDAAACTETLLTDLRLARASNANAPFLLGLIVESSADLTVLNSLQHILPVTRFNVDQLAALQQQLELVSLDRISQALRYERIVGAQRMLHYNLEELRQFHHPGYILPFDNVHHEAEEMAAGLLLLAMANRPEGSKMIDAASYANFMHDNVLPCVDEAEGTILLSRVAAMEAALEARKNAAGRLTPQGDLPDHFGKILAKSAKHQALVRDALLWCAIERFRLKHEKIPDRLEELVPEFVDKLPCDPVNGLPLRYVRKGERDYLLYSIGWNGTDDGGVEARRDGEGDWVWASDPRLIVNLDEEKRKAEEKADAEKETRWKVVKEKREAEYNARKEADARAKAEAGKESTPSK